MSKTVQPLCDVIRTTPSEKAGYELNPRYMWCVREFSLLLGCGHTVVLARMTAGGGTDPRRPLPARLRCKQCPPHVSQSRRHPAATAKTPVTDPVVGFLAAELSAAYTHMPERQMWVTEWSANYGGHVNDESLRQRGYAAMALRVVDEHLANTDNKHAFQVRDAVQAWRNEPSDTTRSSVCAARKKLYDSQLRGGDWYAHRALIAAAKLASPYPHNAQAAREATEFGTQREMVDHEMRSARTDHDHQFIASMLAAQIDDNDAFDKHWNSAVTSDERLAALVEATKPMDSLLAEDLLVVFQHEVCGSAASTGT